MTETATPSGAPETPKSFNRRHLEQQQREPRSCRVDPAAVEPRRLTVQLGELGRVAEWDLSPYREIARARGRETHARLAPSEAGRPDLAELLRRQDERRLSELPDDLRVPITLTLDAECQVIVTAEIELEHTGSVFYGPLSNLPEPLLRRTRHELPDTMPPINPLAPKPRE